MTKSLYIKPHHCHPELVEGQQLTNMKIEICANGFESAKIAQETGANRIELCENLSVGGLTPSRELITNVVKEIGIETQVLIRPRAGDFYYTEAEIETMIQDISFCKSIGCAGVVSGILTSEMHIDVANTQRLITAAQGMEFTFHRAFDVCDNPLQAFKQLKDLNITRLLSSGQEPKAIDGIELLKQLKNLSEDKIEIMPGGGVHPTNALAFKKAGFKMLHFSAIKKEAAAQSDDLFTAEISGVSNAATILEIKKILGL